MVDIIVERAGSQGFKSDDVLEPLIGDSEAAAIARGSAVLDENGTGLQRLTYEVDFTSGVRCGQVVRIRDSTFEKFITGKVVNMSITGSRGSEGALEVMLQLTISQPTEFFVQPTE